MTNYLNPKLSNDELHKMSVLALAHTGDSVYEILCRLKLATNGVLTSKNMHKLTVSLVNANSQAKALDCIFDLLLDDEKSYYIRGRNSKPKSVPKSTTREDYGKATGIETLFGYLYLTQKYDRINELFDIIYKNFNLAE